MSSELRQGSFGWSNNKIFSVYCTATKVSHMQFPHLFELTGAFALWAATGLKGKFKDFLTRDFLARRQPNYRIAYLGVLIYVVLVIVIIQFIPAK